MKPIVQWIDEQKAMNIYTSTYWNNVEVEKEKEWWVTDKDDKKLINYLHSSGLFEEFEIVRIKLEERRLLRGNVLDVAAGVCWMSALLSKCNQVEHIDAIDFSLHRIKHLAPIVCEQFKANLDKIQRIYGSFYDIKKSAYEYDLIIMSQAFHHAQRPLQLLAECDRVLKPGGAIVLIGEHLITRIRYLIRVIARIAKCLILNRNINLNGTASNNGCVEITL